MPPKRNIDFYPLLCQNYLSQLPEMHFINWAHMMRHTKHIQTICSHDNKVLTEKTDVAEAKYLFEMQELSPQRKLMLISQIS